MGTAREEAAGITMRDDRILKGKPKRYFGPVSSRAPRNFDVWRSQRTDAICPPYPLHVALLCGSRVNSAITSHSPACFRNSSRACILPTSPQWYGSVHRHNWESGRPFLSFLELRAAPERIGNCMTRFITSVAGHPQGRTSEGGSSFRICTHGLGGDHQNCQSRPQAITTPGIPRRWAGLVFPQRCLSRPERDHHSAPTPAPQSGQYASSALIARCSWLSAIL